MEDNAERQLAAHQLCAQLECLLAEYQQTATQQDVDYPLSLEQRGLRQQLLREALQLDRVRDQLQEIDPELSFKHNNLHDIIQKRIN